MSSGGTACVNDSIQIGIKGNSASIWPKKPNTVRMCSSSFALTYCCSLIQSTSTDGALFEPLAVWWAWRTQGRLRPLPGHTQELRTQGRAHGIFFPAFWGTGDLSQDVPLLSNSLWDRLWDGRMVYIPLNFPTATEAGVPGPVLQLRKLKLRETKGSRS